MRRKPKVPANDLPPLWIPNLFPPRPGEKRFDGGLGVRHAEQNLEVLLKHPEGAVPGTFIQLFWNDTPSASDQMIVEDKHKDLDYFVLSVPADIVRWQAPNPVRCTVQRPSGNKQQTSPLHLLVKMTRPGDRDPNDSLEGHQGLNFNLPEDIKVDGVDDARAQRNILIEILPWVHMALFDTCILTWGSETITHLVQEDEVGNPFFMVVDYITIRRAGDNELLPVAMQVMDAVGNYPDFYAPWSARQYVRTTLNLNLLDAPYLDDFVGDVDLGELGEDPLGVSFYAGRQDFEEGDEVTLIWVGRDADGLLIPYTLLVPVTLTGRILHFNIPNALVRAIAEGSFTVSYDLYKRTDQLTRHSKKLQARVVGEYIPWPAPNVVEARADGYLDPDLVSATVVFQAQPGWAPEHWLSVTWTGSNSDGTVRFSLEREVGVIPPDGRIVFTLNASDIRSFKGLMTRITYELRDQQTAPTYRRESLPLFLRVGELVAGLMAPLIHLALGDWLNPVEVPAAGATGEIPFIETLPGDNLTLYWRGETEALSTMQRFTLDESTAGEVVAFTIALALVLANVGKHVSVSYLLERPGQLPRYSNTLLLTIEEREVILVEDFEDMENRLIGPGEHLDINSMTLTYLSGTAQAGIRTYSTPPQFIGMLDGPAIMMNYATNHQVGEYLQRIRLTFKFRYTYIKFAITWIHHPAEIYFYDKNILLKTVELPGQFTQPGQGAWVEYPAPAGSIISHMEVVTRDYSFLDFFSFRT